MKAVIFDLDGVITDTAEYHFLAWKRIAEQLHIPFDRSFNESLKGIGRQQSLDNILTRGGAASTFTTAEKQALMRQKNQYYQKLIENLAPGDLLPGIGKLLSELKDEHIQIALASSSRNAPAILKRLGISGDFQALVDPLLGVSPAECAAIEDAEAGIAAIKSAGMFAVGVGDERSMHAADLIVSRTSQLSFHLLYSGWKRCRERQQTERS